MVNSEQNWFKLISKVVQIHSFEASSSSLEREFYLIKLEFGNEKNVPGVSLFLNRFLVLYSVILTKM